jgi:hypothetical protein
MDFLPRPSPVAPTALLESQDGSGRSFTHGLRTEGVFGRNWRRVTHEKTIQVLNLEGLVWWS